MVNSYAPHPALRDLVGSIQIATMNFAAEPTLSAFHTCRPSHTRCLFFYLEDVLKVKKATTGFVQRSRGLIVGPQVTMASLDLGIRYKAVMLSLTPSGMYRLLGVPLHEMVDCDFDARLILGPAIDECVEQMMEAKTDDDIQQALQAYLLGKLSCLKPALPFDRAIAELVCQSGNLSVDFVAAQSCLSPRQFERQARQRLGLSPKFYARLVRFSHVYKYKELNPRASWIDIAARFGYYDQMHLIRDFKQFAGFSPRGLTEEAIPHSVRFRALDD